MPSPSGRLLCIDSSLAATMMGRLVNSLLGMVGKAPHFFASAILYRGFAFVCFAAVYAGDPRKSVKAAKAPAAKKAPCKKCKKA